MQHDKDKEQVTPASANPRWWREEHTSAWTRIKEAMRRDWEQTKRDFGDKSGGVVHQSIGDTVKQIVGKEPISSVDWSTVEPAMRFGFGAGVYHKDIDFEAHETKLEREWNDMKPSRPWAESRDYVRRGWEWSRRKD